MRFFSRQTQFKRYQEYALGWLPKLKSYRRELDKTAMFYVLWNEAITLDRQEVFLHRIEDDDENLLKFVGAPKRQGLFDDRKANNRGEVTYRFTLASLRDDVRKALEEYSDSIGYTLQEDV